MPIVEHSAGLTRNNGVLGAIRGADRDVLLELNLPNGGTPQLRIVEGGTDIVELPGVGKFGFVPRVQDSGNVVLVDVFDLNATPHERLGRLEAVVGGDRVQSETKPDFGVRVLRLITQ